jgi:hypothetical protein
MLVLAVVVAIVAFAVLVLGVSLVVPITAVAVVLL